MPEAGMIVIYINPTGLDAERTELVRKNMVDAISQTLQQNSITASVNGVVMTNEIMSNAMQLISR